MKKITFTATTMSALLLTGCIPLDSDQAGRPFENFAKQAAAAVDPANVSATQKAAASAHDGASYKSSFDPTQSQYAASKSTSANLIGLDVDITAGVQAIANGTSRVKNGSVWDRVQNHPITIELNVGVNLGIDDAKNDNTDVAKVTVANFSIQGEFGTSSVAAFKDYESDPDGDLEGKKVGDLSSEDFIPAGGTIKAVISDGSIEDYVKDLLGYKKAIEDNELYGAYRNGDQYTAFYAAGTEATSASQVENKATNSVYDINYRGIATWGSTDYNQLGGTGSLTVNFNAGTYIGAVAVTNSGAAFGDIAFAGTSTNTTTFTDNSATFDRTGGSGPVSGYVEGSAYGDNAATFMGTTDFAYDDDVLVGSFNATAQ